jgi:purine-nucleoside phosphorylase
MSELRARIDAAVAAIRKQSTLEPSVAIILGTGLDRLAEAIEEKTIISYGNIPGFPTPTVAHHVGELVLGRLGGRSVVAMNGRFHYYEGYSMQEVTFPVRVMKALGAAVLIVSNACGGMNPVYEAGDIFIIDDHINLLPGNPLIGPNDESLGPRFPDMCAPYDPALVALAQRIALEEGIRAHKGVYVAVAGPNLETRAEYRFLRAIGADVVGMSTVPEVLVAVHGGMRVLGVAVVTDTCLPDALKPANIEEIIRVANEAEPKLTRVVLRVLKEMDAR